MCHHIILGEKTPEEEFTGVKPKVSHFHIFGYLVYIHIPVEKKTTLEPSNKTRVSLLYIVRIQRPTNIYIPRERKKNVSNNVKFEEDFASKKSHEPILN